MRRINLHCYWIIHRVDASSDFNGTANVPKIAITISILLSKRIVLLVWGKIKPI
jgi:glucosamine-6-phosphate deaminase